MQVYIIQFNTILGYCNPNPCLNNGNCTTGKTDYTCSCPAQYTGQRCELGNTD